LIAQESKEPKAIISAIQELIESCTFGKVTISELTMFDVEYIFLKIRSKSVGEVVKLKSKCPIDEQENEISVNLDELTVDFPKISTKIVLADKVGIVMKYPSFEDIKNLSKFKDDEKIKMLNATIVACIDYIYDADAIYKASETTNKDLEVFIDSLNSKQFQDVQNFISNIPKLKYVTTVKCSKCGHEYEVVLEGIQSFF
jgi:glycine cleavage system regulatory protein